MKSGPILAILAAGGLIGWFSPDAAEAPAADAAASPSQPVQVTGRSRAQALRTDSWGAGELMLPREPDGHFYADVSVDSVTARMLVDTGASVVALTAEDAEAMGVFWEPDEIRPVAEGVNGTVYGVSVTLDHVQLGDVEARGVEAIVVPQGLGISLLGQSFLGRIERVEITEQGMLLAS